ncbi:MAG: phosphate/phosphite/phosphonate ABC transporter substrate-binding protein [Armatimonadetes bacterium]|nr:phosphate/phosphite/phosphonate ABC transporter substrate-binding protein [Armatimonadota bacterium]
MRKLLLLLPALLALLAAGCGRHEASGPQALKVGVIPYDKVDVVKEDYGRFAAYLGKKTGRGDGEVFVTPEYAGVLTALRSDQIDCAFLNPLSYVLAVEEFRNTPEHLIPLAMPYFHNSLTYRGILYVRADSGINSLKDLRGKSVAFNDRTSTSGYLYPAGMMMHAGVDPNKDVRPVNISGTSGVLAVLNHQADAGAGYEGVIDRALANETTKKVDTAQAKQLKVLAYTEPIPNGMIVARGNLDPKTLDALKQALVSVNSDPDGQAALAKIPWNKVVPPDDHLFDSVRDKAKILNLNLQSLDAPKH